MPNGLGGELLRFGIVGYICTVAYFLIYLWLSAPFGDYWANLIALFTTTVANTGANRFFTFGVIGKKGMIKHHLGGLVAFGVAVLLTSTFLAGLNWAWPLAPQLVEVAVLAFANILATAVRFFCLKTLITSSSR